VVGEADGVGVEDVGLRTTYSQCKLPALMPRSRFQRIVELEEKILEENGYKV
jgi:hypothetical protein